MPLLYSAIGSLGVFGKKYRLNPVSVDNCWGNTRWSNPVTASSCSRLIGSISYGTRSAIRMCHAMCLGVFCLLPQIKKGTCQRWERGWRRLDVIGYLNFFMYSNSNIIQQLFSAESVMDVDNVYVLHTNEAGGSMCLCVCFHSHLSCT